MSAVVPYPLLFAEPIWTISLEAMKRARIPDDPRGIVRLNIGGKKFQMTRATLSGCCFCLLPYLNSKVKEAKTKMEISSLIAIGSSFL